MESTELTENTEKQELTPEQKKEAFFNDTIEILETMLTSVFVVLLLFTYLMRPVTVDGHSMVPTLQDNDRLVMRRILYQPHQGDIVVVSNYGTGHVLGADGSVVSSGTALNKILIKRVIAVEGQTVDVRTDEKLVYVDGEPLQEDYINEPTGTNDGAFSYPITIPEGYVFVMGDNRNHSTDSRNANVGLIPKEDILGNAFFRYCAIDVTTEVVKKEDGTLEEKETGRTHFDTAGFIS